MIHFVTWIPHPYQQALCRVLNDHYGSDFLVWFAESASEEFPHKVSPVEGFRSRYLDREGYGDLFRAIFADKEAVVILGGWFAPMSVRTIGRGELPR